MPYKNAIAVLLKVVRKLVNTCDLGVLRIQSDPVSLKKTGVIGMSIGRENVSVYGLRRIVKDSQQKIINVIGLIQRNSVGRLGSGENEAFRSLVFVIGQDIQHLPDHAQKPVNVVDNLKYQEGNTWTWTIVTKPGYFVDGYVGNVIMQSGLLGIQLQDFREPLSI